MHGMRYAWIVGFCTLTLAPLIASAAWTGPTQSPPNGNMAAPINVGTTDQVKDANIGTNGLVVFGNSLFGGSTGSNAYLNFGGTTGASGYGIRDNAGLLEFKNSAGSWQSIQNALYTLCGGPCGGGGQWTTSGNNISNSNTGNVGIGTMNPTAKLQIGNMLTLQDTVSTQTSLGWNVYHTPDNPGSWHYINTGTGAAIRMNGGPYDHSPSNPIFGGNHWGISFHVNPIGSANANIPTMDTSDVKMVIREDGNVGIGMVIPSVKLNVVGGRILLQPSSASPGQGLQIDTADLAYGSNGIFVNAPAGWTGNLMSANSGGVQQFAISQNGSVSLSNQLYARNLNNSAGTYAVCWSAGTGQLTTAYACSSSDARLKTDVRDFEGGLPKVEALRPVTFEWKDKSRGEGNQIGLIAQEVEKIAPEIVSTDSAGIKSIDYARLTPILIKGMQEQQAEIESQNAEIQSLKADIEELRSALRTK